jgi:hypothetical protein
MHAQTAAIAPQSTNGVSSSTFSTVNNSNNDSQHCPTASKNYCEGDLSNGDVTKDDGDILAVQSPPPVSPQLGQRHNAHAQNDSLILQDGVLRSLRDSTQDLTGGCGGGGSAPLSPRPWYKRSVARDEKQQRTATTTAGGGKKKSKSPDNLPEIQPGREGITLNQTFEEKYSYFIRKVPWHNLQFRIQNGTVFFILIFGNFHKQLYLYSIFNEVV